MIVFSKSFNLNMILNLSWADLTSKLGDFQANVPFLYPLKILIKLWFSDVFRACRNATLILKWYTFFQKVSCNFDSVSYVRLLDLVYLWLKIRLVNDFIKVAAKLTFHQWYVRSNPKIWIRQEITLLFTTKTEQILLLFEYIFLNYLQDVCN